MNKIYFQNKQEFINNVTQYINCNEYLTSKYLPLTFIKKHHKYEQFLNFLPNVLMNIIFEYINDIMIVCYMIKKSYTGSHPCEYVFFFSYIIVNYKIIDFDNHIIFDKWHKQLLLASTPNQHIRILSYNEFMKRHYKKESYISHNMHKTLLNKEYLSIIKDHDFIQLKYEIIITKKIIDCITKIIIK